MSEQIYLVDKKKFMEKKNFFDGLTFWKEHPTDPTKVEVRIAVFESMTLEELKKIM